MLSANLIFFTLFTFNTQTVNTISNGGSMAINKEQMRELVRDTLIYLEPEIKYSKSAEELIVMTIAQETDMGGAIKQIKGPALGITQIEPRTYKDLYRSLGYHPFIEKKINTLASAWWNDQYRQSGDANPYELVYNLRYAIAMTRYFYLTKPGSLPSPDDTKGLAEYYKKYYNTPAGKATVEETIKRYNKYK